MQGLPAAAATLSMNPIAIIWSSELNSETKGSRLALTMTRPAAGAMPA